MASLLISNGTIITMDEDRTRLTGHIAVQNDRIVAITPERPAGRFDHEIDATGKIVIPGLIQTHVHLTQALFRGQADDMVLMDWLQKRVWPLEASHDAESNYYSAQLGLAEMLLGGTTAIVDMETVYHADDAIRAIEESGMRAITGKCLMSDDPSLPAGLRQPNQAALQETMDLYQKWHMADNGRIRYALTPRFVVSCDEELLLEVVRLAEQYDLMIHSHASESRGEIAIVEDKFGRPNVEYLHKIGLSGPHVILAHCIWLNEREMDILVDTKTRISHCPGSNLKLASGIAKIPELLKRGAKISIGSDGAPCNNRMSVFNEMYLAALIQKVRLGDPQALNADEVLAMATRGGAEAMGQLDDIGSLEVGKKADITIISLNQAHQQPAEQIDPVAQIVYASQAQDVYATIVDGRVLMEDRQLKTLDYTDIKTNTNRIIAQKLARL